MKFQEFSGKLLPWDATDRTSQIFRLSSDLKHNFSLPPPPSMAGAGDSYHQGNIRMTLEDPDLWRSFHEIGTEMIITKPGRYVLEPSSSTKTLKSLDQLNSKNLPQCRCETLILSYAYITGGCFHTAKSACPDWCHMQSISYWWTWYLKTVSDIRLEPQSHLVFLL